MSKLQGRGSIFHTLNYSFFIVMGIIMIYPFWYVVMISISDATRPAINGYYIFPNGFSLDAYSEVLALPIITKSYINTIFITVVGTVYKVIMTVMTAYPLSRPKLRGKQFIFNMFLLTMVFSGGLIPTYLMVRSLGLVDSRLVFIIPFAVDVYLLMITLKFFKGISQSLIESAKIDGYNDVSILFKVVLPLSPAVIAVLCLFYAVGQWNNYTTGLIYINTQSKQVLQVVLQSLLVSSEQMHQAPKPDVKVTTQGLRMATIVVSILPILFVYPFVQKYFITGMTLGAVKE